MYSSWLGEGSSYPSLESVQGGCCDEGLWQLVPQDGRGWEEGVLHNFSAIPLFQKPLGVASCDGGSLWTEVVLCWDCYLVIHDLVEHDRLRLLPALFKTLPAKCGDHRCHAASS